MLYIKSCFRNSVNVSTNLGEKFLNLVSKCFPKGSALAKAFNRNNLKLSYRTMPNIGDKISAHNKQFLGGVSNNPPMQYNCNCRVKGDCPLNGNCLTESLIYKATVDNNQTYIGITGGTLKQRYTTHKASFRHEDKRNATQLSKHIWTKKDQGQDPNIKWECVETAPVYNPIIGRCILCLKEKEKISDK